MYINGGIQPFIDRVRALGGADIPLNKRAYMLYHMAKQDVYDPEFYAMMEKGLVLASGQPGEHQERAKGE